MLSKRFDWQEGPGGRGLLTGARDPLGNETALTYEQPYGLLAALSTDPIGLTTSTTYDYHTMKPRQVIDQNGNVTAFEYSPLGMLESSWLIGKPGSNAADVTNPIVRWNYDLLAFVERRQPGSVHAIRRVHHDAETDVSLMERDATLNTVEYFDGFGRLLQKRLQAEDVIFENGSFPEPLLGSSGLSSDPTAPLQPALGARRQSGSPVNVVVTGWQTYDNRGLVIEQYEPFFSRGWDYASPLDYQLGQTLTVLHDALGRDVRTIYPDSSERHVVYGVPGNITAPDFSDTGRFEPTPWEVYVFDRNDNAGRTHGAEAQALQHRRRPKTFDQAERCPARCRCRGRGSRHGVDARSEGGPASDFRAGRRRVRCTIRLQASSAYPSSRSRPHS